MPEKPSFAEVLTRLRGAAGFRTAFAFYRARDGRRALGVAFPNYLKLERGRHLPQPRRLEPIIAALGFAPDSPEARELVRAYLGSVLGSERLLKIATGSTPVDPAPASWLMAEAASRQAISQRSVQLSLDQYRALAADADAYACHVILANTQAWVSRTELARLTGLPIALVSRALAVLEKSGLAERREDDARSPLAGRFVVPPGATSLTAGIYAALRKHRAAWDRRTVDSAYFVLRARKDAMGRYMHHLSDAVKLSTVYGDAKPGEDSSIYLVEARLSEVFR